MLNISDNTIIGKFDSANYRSFQRTNLPGSARLFKRWLLVFFLIFVVILFLPWTQNVQTRGKVTTLRPDQRPQTIHATIAGRIEKWYVREGELVKKGDTILQLSEIKTDYFDPNLIQRTASQVNATEAAVTSYENKVDALNSQIAAMQQELNFKRQQLRNKAEQTQLKLASDSIEVVRAKVDFDIAQNQFLRAKEMFDKGLISLTTLEQRSLKVQETSAKQLESENKWLSAGNEFEIARIELVNLENEYVNKIAKAQSDKFTALSDRFGKETTLNKLQVDLANYQQRSGFYYITAPQECYITQAMVAGLGETVKEGEPVVSIMPAHATLAVEMFVLPNDLPLIAAGNRVNLIFDGWPAFVFSGWPNLTFGTYESTVAGIDNNIGANGYYRVLLAPQELTKPWPQALRPGGGAQCFALLKDVPVWYELWRKLNSFPPDFYKIDEKSSDTKNAK